MERKRTGTQSGPNVESAHKGTPNPRGTLAPLPKSSSTTQAEPRTLPSVHSEQPLPSEQERLRLIVGAAKQRSETTPLTTTQSDTTRRPRRHRRVTPRFFAFVACAMLVFLTFSYAVAFWRIRAVEQRILAVTSEKEAAIARNEQLKEELEKVSGDEYIEEVAREELGLVKQGETAWVLMTPEDPNSPFKVEERATSKSNASEGW